MRGLFRGYIELYRGSAGSYGDLVRHRGDVGM